MKTLSRRTFSSLMCVGLFATACGVSPVVAASSLYFPPAKGEWEKADLTASGWNAEKLNEALEYAHKKQSSGMVILWRGKILAEQYWTPDSVSSGTTAKGKARIYAQVLRGKDAAGHVIEDVASIQKSVAAVLTGIAQNKGLLKISDSVDQYLGTGWSKASPEEEHAITIRHLLTMSSGLKDDLTFEAPAGTRWRYNTAAYSRTVKVLAAVTKKKPDELTHEWLTGPIGMADSHWTERRGVGEEARVNALGFATTARDLARFGLLVLADGQWQSETIVADHDYLHAALKPSQTMNPSYGYLWWLNGQSEVARGAGQKVKGPLIPSAPSDLVAGLGAGDRKLFVVPSLELVVTRLGDQTGPAFDSEFWKLLSAAAPKK